MQSPSGAENDVPVVPVYEVAIAFGGQMQWVAGKRDAIRKMK
jgi:hypothetical protein